MGKKKRKTRSTATSPRYFVVSQQPMHALVFLLPLLLFYEAGVLWVTSQGQTPLANELVATEIIREFFQLFGVTGYHLPAFVVAAVLIAWHLVRGDPFKFEMQTYIIMLIESLCFVVPLIVMSMVFTRTFSTNMAESLHSLAAARDPAVRIVQSVGAGIYEELVFRMVAIALIHLVVVDVLALPDKWGALAAVAGSSLLFAAAHFLGDRGFSAGLFFFFTFAGVYFSALYLLRGFGIVVAVHALYDIIVVLLNVKGGDW